LGFKDAVLSAFDFLRSYGLKPVQEEVTFVRYESKAVFVNVYHGRASFEIGVEIGRFDRPEKYGLDYIVSWAGKQAWEAEGFGQSTMFQVSSREGVQRFVPKVADLVRKYGDPFLRGEASFYDQLEKANERASVDFQKQQRLKSVRKEAAAVWSEKNYVRAVALYRSIQEDLTEVETRRLAYAEKHTLVPTVGNPHPSARKKR
jgi:hypothetical protein